jgi:hypothetical protein
MSGDDHRISIWFFVGALLGVYGALILGAGIWDLFYPSGLPQAMGHLHVAIWWGALLLVFGLFYCVRFWPGGQSRR